MRAVRARDIVGYRFPRARCKGPRRRGNGGPRKGSPFPEQIAAVFELHRRAIRRAGVDVERPNRAAQDVSVEAERARIRGDLQVHASTGPQRPRPLNQGPACAQINQRDRVAGAQRGTCESQERWQEARVVSAIR